MIRSILTKVQSVKGVINQVTIYRDAAQGIAREKRKSLRSKSWRNLSLPRSECAVRDQMGGRMGWAGPAAVKKKVQYEPNPLDHSFSFTMRGIVSQ